jgi:PAS domain S-box-containing protein
MNSPDARAVNGTDASSARIAELFNEQRQNIIRHTDRLFSWLMIFQWVFAVGVTFWLSPRAWAGVNSQIHPHVWLAIFLGGIITSVPVLLARTQPGKPLTRHTVAVGQMLMGALLIHLTGGRIETHFHVFCSLAILAFYRDWRVLISASVVVCLDHLLRGTFLPQSVYGVLSASIWRSLEHAGWVAFEVAFLIVSIRKSLGEMHLMAERQAGLEAVNENIEHNVAERTAELAQERLLLRTLIDNLPDSIYTKDSTGRKTMANPADLKNLRCKTEAEAVGKSDFDFFPKEIAERFWGDDQKVIQGEPVLNREEHFLDEAGQKCWLLTSKLPLRDEDGKIVGLMGIGRDITERKEADARLEEAHKRLLEVSRQAGMSEVATSVLHNVGNVLNSVNVSSSLISEKIKNSKVPNIAKAVALMRAHESDLANFLTQDPKGRQLLEYLANLAAHLTQEQADVLQETGSLANKIMHIKEIVAMQQNCARTSGVPESLSSVDLVEDAVRMNITSMERHHVKVVREYAEVPPILVEKHKVLQILVNLISNAKYACNHSGREDKQITLRVANGAGRIKISVTDNGVGIPGENLTRIFNHGFTTKKNGHGFGLHSGALAANELGGKLLAFSEGPDRGAIFTLELPVQKPTTNL